jgi:hypothetical protein
MSGIWAWVWAWLETHLPDRCAIYDDDEDEEAGRSTQALCSYEMVWTDEVGTIPVCRLHGNNSRHEPSDDPHRPCLTVDPYPRAAS